LIECKLSLHAADTFEANTVDNIFSNYNNLTTALHHCNHRKKPGSENSLHFELPQIGKMWIKSSIDDQYRKIYFLEDGFSCDI